MELVHFGIEDKNPHGIKVKNPGYLLDHLFQDPLQLQRLVYGGSDVIKGGKLLSPSNGLLEKTGIIHAHTYFSHDGTYQFQLPRRKTAAGIVGKV